MKEAPKNYSLMMRTIHWFSALTVVGMFGSGLWMVDLSYYSEWYKTAPHWHKSIGIMLAAITIFRFLWKAFTKQPKTEGKKPEVLLAKVAHFSIYLLLAALFVSGYLISTSDGRGIDIFNWFTLPGAGEIFSNQSDIAGRIHLYAAVSLIALSVLHALAAIKHHYIDKDNTLNKMIGKAK
ncbi:cytochrome b (plasmid) [Vibrio parahaemolyticus]|uniref:cytochrome b n=1 Tax=Vibrio TaxID=662 RepID=UPI0005F246F7|nr:MULTISPECIES: cytochrome b [Vibrio]EJG0765964.1 cytochrome b [Vibrio parahaemolyticus O5:K30]EGR2220544.1 cytochrome b [Vibrio parahaemolyticus]MBE4202584.1 cytochrome b [Vibrio parahaemolyticus]MDG2755890.1 cytochrome b [Vibrio parahaemolyticus]TBT51815.1 cytochrome b [Vibrio parahaemolyticus]